MWDLEPCTISLQPTPTALIISICKSYIWTGKLSCIPLSLKDLCPKNKILTDIFQELYMLKPSLWFWIYEDRNKFTSFKSVSCPDQLGHMMLQFKCLFKCHCFWFIIKKAPYGTKIDLSLENFDLLGRGRRNLPWIRLPTRRDLPGKWPLGTLQESFWFL